MSTWTFLIMPTGVIRGTPRDAGRVPRSRARTHQESQNSPTYLEGFRHLEVPATHAGRGTASRVPRSERPPTSTTEDDHMTTDPTAHLDLRRRLHRLAVDVLEVPPAYLPHLAAEVDHLADVVAAVVAGDPRPPLDAEGCC